MGADVVDNWLAARRPARLNGVRVRPVEHTVLQGVALSIQRGQAEAFPLREDTGTRWILKRFHAGRALDRQYLESVSKLLPDEPGFRSGTARHILTANSLRRGRGCYFDSALARWLDHSVLMPSASGVDWASIADELREGDAALERPHRFTLCRGLIDLVSSLEDRELAHRDLSAGNVFIDPQSLAVSLIDFDSMFHTSLSMPAATTCGTEGYTPHFAWRNGTVDPSDTWCRLSDRFALSILIVEFLVLTKDAPLAAEGGMFPQDELRAQRGPTLDLAHKLLRTGYPAAVPFLDAAIHAKGFSDCRTPQQWTQLFDVMPGAPARPPRLEQVEVVASDFFQRLLEKSRPAAAIWPAPALADMPVAAVRLPQGPAVGVTLPPDPWQGWVGGAGA